MENILENTKKILYVNGGVDFDPIDVFDAATEYIYVDTMPRAEKDGYYLKSRLYRGQFIDQVIVNMLKRGFVLASIVVLNADYTWKIASIRQKLKHGIGKLMGVRSLELQQVNPTKYTFVNRAFNKKVKYYMNTNVKYNMDAELHHDIMYSDAVVVSGSVPPKMIVEHFYKPKMFVTRESGFRHLYMNDDREPHLLSTIRGGSGDRYFSSYLFFDDDWETYRCFSSSNDIFL